MATAPSSLDVEPQAPQAATAKDWREAKRDRKFEKEESQLLKKFKAFIGTQASAGNLPSSIKELSDESLLEMLRHPDEVAGTYPEFEQSSRNKLRKRLLDFSTKWYDEKLEASNLHQNKGRGDEASGDYDVEAIGSHVYTKNTDGFTSIDTDVYSQDGQRKVNTGDQFDENDIEVKQGSSEFGFMDEDIEA